MTPNCPICSANTHVQAKATVLLHAGNKSAEAKITVWTCTICGKTFIPQEQ